MKTCWTLFLLASCLAALAEQTNLYTWSSTGCAKCQSTIVYQAWYPDGSPLVAEGMSGTNAGALVALSHVKNNLVVSLGLSISHNPSLILNLKESVTLETNSSTHMVLYAMDEPGPGFHKDDIAILRSLNIRSLTLRPYTSTSGFLFFPCDGNATDVVVVVRVGGETFRFPFRQNPTARAKFEDPAKLASVPVANRAPGSSESSQSVRSCTKNVSFALSEQGQLVAQSPEFTQRWLAKNGRQYPGLCFSQTPNPGSANYLIAFGPSATAFEGFSPSVSAAAWIYHYSGAAGGASTTFISLPFADKTRSFYAFTYDQAGRLVSRRQRTVTARTSPGIASNLGVSVAAAIAASHLKEHLLEDAVHDLMR